MTDIESLAADLLSQLRQPKNRQHYWVGLAGAPGSGKSTLANKLCEQLGDVITVIPMDGYHFYRHELDAMPDPKQAHARRGSPFTFNAARFVKDLQQAKQTGQGTFPEFQHGNGDPVEDAIELTADRNQIVLVEGNYLLLNEQPWHLLNDSVFDETWFLDVPLTECQKRIYQRHVSVGRAPEIAQHRIDSNDGPNAELVIRTCRDKADRLIKVEQFD